LTNFLLRDNLFRDTAPVPFLSFVYRDYIPFVYQTCTATAPAVNKNYTRMAKSTPYLACLRDNFPTFTAEAVTAGRLAKVSGLVPGWLRRVTQPPHIAGPLAAKKIVVKLYSQI
jgi:hypothetical protein